MGDGSRNKIEYTTAERMSFQVVPETCPAVEGALDKARLVFDQGEIDKALAAYKIESSKPLQNAISEIIHSHLFMALHDVRKAVLYKGTFVLRRALVEVMEDQLRAKGVSPEPNHFAGWIKAHEGMEAVRARSTSS